MQARLVAGDTLAFRTTLVDYPAGAGWTLRYRLVPQVDGPTPIEIVASADGDEYLIGVTAGTTATWIAGTYSWSSTIDLGGERYTVEAGQIVIAPNPATATTLDNRSEAARAVADLKAALATYTATQGHVSEYAIGDRSMKFKDAKDILALLTYWQGELRAEQECAAAAAGRPSRRRTYLRVGSYA